MDLDQKYVLGDVVANDGESKSFRAREIATGREVLVHILYGGRSEGREPLLNSLLQQSMHTAPERRRQIIEIDDHKGMPYAVTEVISDFRGLRDWMDRERGFTQVPAPGEPERMTRAGRWQVPPGLLDAQRPGGTSAGQAGQASREPGAPPPPQAPPQQKQGEFTALFRATVGERPAAPGMTQQPPVPPPAVPQPPAVPPMSAVQPSHAAHPSPYQHPATQAPLTTPPAPAPAAPQAAPLPPPPQQPAPQVGEFTRVFGGSPLSEPERAPHEWMTTRPAPESPRRQDPASFTSLFQKTMAPGVGAPPQAPPQPSGLGAPSFPPPPPAAAPPETPSAGEFTRFFTGPVESLSSSEEFQAPLPAQKSAPPLGPPPTPAAPPRSAVPAGPSPLVESESPFGLPGGPEQQASPFAAEKPGEGKQEFTKYFSGPPAPGQTAGGSAFGAPPPPRGSGSATGAFAAVGGPSQPSQAPPPPSSLGPGEYTMFFESPRFTPGEPAGGGPRPGAPGAPQPGGMQMPGMPGGMQPPPPPGMQLPGFQAPQFQSPQFPPPAAPPMPGMQAPQMPGMQMPGMAMQPPKAKSGPLILILVIMGVLLVIAVLVIVWLMFRK